MVKLECGGPQIVRRPRRTSHGRAMPVDRGGEWVVFLRSTAQERPSDRRPSQPAPGGDPDRHIAIDDCSCCVDPSHRPYRSTAPASMAEWSRRRFEQECCPVSLKPDQSQVIGRYPIQRQCPRLCHSFELVGTEHRPQHPFHRDMRLEMLIAGTRGLQTHLRTFDAKSDGRECRQEDRYGKNSMSPHATALTPGVRLRWRCGA